MALSPCGGVVVLLRSYMANTNAEIKMLLNEISEVLRVFCAVGEGGEEERRGEEVGGERGCADLCCAPSCCGLALRA